MSALSLELLTLVARVRELEVAVNSVRTLADDWNEFPGAPMEDDAGDYAQELYRALGDNK